MSYETIDTSIEVIAHFTGKTINPLRFLWSNRSYKIKKVQHKWVERQGDIKLVHFKIEVDSSDIVEIIFNNETFEWRLKEVNIAGGF
jgi:hypothetical protein